MMTMVKRMRITLNPEPQEYFQKQAMHRPPLDRLLRVHWNCCHSKTFRSQELTSLHSSAWSMTRIYPPPDLTVWSVTLLMFDSVAPGQRPMCSGFSDLIVKLQGFVAPNKEFLSYDAALFVKGWPWICDNETGGGVSPSGDR